MSHTEHYDVAIAVRQIYSDERDEIACNSQSSACFLVVVAHQIEKCLGGLEGGTRQPFQTSQFGDRGSKGLPKSQFVGIKWRPCTKWNADSRKPQKWIIMKISGFGRHYNLGSPPL